MRGVLDGVRTYQVVRTLVLFVVAVLAGCTSSGLSAGPSNAAPRPQAQVSTLPGDKAADISPTQPASVSVTGGVLQQVALISPDGKAVAGTFSADRRSWTSAEPLGYGRTYTWNGHRGRP